MELNDGSTRLSIFRNNLEDSYSHFTIRVDTTTIGGERFCAENTGVMFLESDDVRRQIRGFFDDKLPEVVIDASEDCYLKLFAVGARRTVALEYCVVKYVHQEHPLPVHPLRLTGLMVTESEFRNQLCKQLLDICASRD